MSASRAASDPVVPESEWVGIGSHGRLTGGNQIWFVVLFVGNTTFLGVNALFGLPLWLAIVSVILVTGLTGAAVTLYLRLRFPRAAVNLQDDLLRVGRRVTPLVDVDTARFEGGATKRAGSVTIELGVDKRSLARFHLRGRRGVLLSGHERDVLAEALRRSSVAMPRNPDDPKGRFARYNFPTNVTKEEAIEIVLAPPGPGDPVPIPYG